MALTTEQYWCVVPAAGIGKRMGGAVPKQYLPLLDGCVADHTLSTLLKVSLFSRVVVVVSPGDVHWPSCIVASSLRVMRCGGGAERYHSVLNGLRAIESMAHADDWVLVHDIARPCVRLADIERLISRLSDHPVGGLLAAPVRDTMKRADEHHQIVQTVERTGLWHALTPQMFRYALLREAIERGLEEGLVMTDEASAVESMGYAPLLVEGSIDNIKITHPQDLTMAALFLRQRMGELA